MHSEGANSSACACVQTNVAPSFEFRGGVAEEGAASGAEEGASSGAEEGAASGVAKESFKCEFLEAASGA